jgi:hypothetical protein
MMLRKVMLVILFALAFASLGGPATSASESDQRIGAIATRKQREQLRVTPLVNRPNRPLHVYGNTVRWFYHLRVR